MQAQSGQSNGAIFSSHPPRRHPPLSTPRFGRISKSALRVYIALAGERWRAEPNGTLVFSPSQLAADSGMSRNAMFDGLRDLAAGGYIERGRRGRFTTARIVEEREATQ